MSRTDISFYQIWPSRVFNRHGFYQPPANVSCVLMPVWTLNVLNSVDICIVGPHQPMAANHQPTYRRIFADVIVYSFAH